jgi:signal transduction histidine kinase
MVSVKETGPIPHLPAAVEVAAYRIALEALTNVIRHAEAAHCWIQFRANGDLQVEVTDDGRGLPSHPRPGVGLHSMRERATELGGDLVVERRSSGGTRLLARLPLTLVEVDRG